MGLSFGCQSGGIDVQSKDFHQRYHHPHYLLCVKVHVQSNGDIEVHSGNVCLIMSPDELSAMMEGIKTFANTCAVLHNSDRLVVTG